MPVISDQWPGIEEFFIPGEEILLASTAKEVLGYLQELSDEDRQAMGQRARKRVLRSHTAGRRATELLDYIAGCENFRSKLPLSGGTHYGLCRL
nr:glycosyltransferase [Geotalea toluenoxydans]